MFKGHCRQLRQSVGSEVLQESDCKDNRASRSGQPSHDGSLEAHKRENSVGLLTPPSSQPSLGRPHLAHAMRAQLPLRGSVALSVPALVHGILAQAQALAAVRVLDTLARSTNSDYRLFGPQTEQMYAHMDMA